MIGFLVDADMPVHVVTRHLFNVSPAVCGPFEGFRGETREGRPVRLACPPPRMDDLYAAGRLMARFGASLLLHLGHATATPSWARETGLEGVRMLLASPVYDLSGLEPLQHLTPSTARELPVPLPTGLGRKRVVSPVDLPGAVAVGSTALPLTIPCLAETLCVELGVVLWDTAAAGLVEAAREEGLPFVVVKAVRSPVRPGTVRAPRGHLEQDALRHGIEEFLEQSGLLAV